MEFVCFARRVLPLSPQAVRHESVATLVCGSDRCAFQNSGKNVAHPSVKSQSSVPAALIGSLRSAYSLLSRNGMVVDGARYSNEAS